MANGSGLRIGLDDLDSILPNVLHPNIAPHFAPPYTPSPMRPITPGPLDTSGAPDLGGGNPAPAGLNAAPPMDIAKPTRQESNAAGKAEFRAGKPTVDAEPGSSDYFRQNLAQEDYAKQHPWGSPISEHPGFLGKVGHVLGRVGNIAGDILDPNAMTLIPGSDLNNNLQRQANERGLAQAETRETTKEGVEQRPEIAEEKGKLQQQIEDSKEEAAQRRTETTTGAQKDIAATKTGSAEKIAGEKNKTSLALKDMDDQTKQAIEQGRERNRETISATHNQLQRELAEGKQNALTNTSRSMEEMAGTVQRQIPTVTAEIQHLADAIGPLKGRWNDLLVNKGGADFPEFAGLDTDLDLLSSAIVRTHFGARGGQQYRQELRKQFGEAQTPEDLIARINHADTWIKGYANMQPAPNPGAAQAPAAAPGKPGDPLGIL